MPNRVKREQANSLESHLNTRQDRNSYLTGGGSWTWDSGTGTLSWTGTATLHVGGASAATVAPGSVVVGTSAGSIAYVDINRAGSGALTVYGSVLLTDSTNLTDERITLGVRAADGTFHFRNGTVMFDGETKQFGTLLSVADRSAITTDGTAGPHSVGFTYIPGSGQLAVFVGGVLAELGVDYTETSSTQITFAAGKIPSAGERILFANLVGGQGPSPTGTVSLQDAWAVNNQVDVTTGSAVALEGLAGQTVLSVQYDPGGGAQETAAVVADTGDYEVVSGTGGVRVHANDGSGDMWGVLPLDDGGKDLVVLLDGAASPKQGVRVANTGLLEFGDYTGAYPGGAWSGDGGIRWSVYTGTLNSGAFTDISTGLSGILGVVFSVLDGSTGRVLCGEADGAVVADRAYGISFDPGTGNVRIALGTDGVGSPGTDVDGEAYSLVVFHQG